MWYMQLWCRPKVSFPSFKRAGSHHWCVDCMRFPGSSPLVWVLSQVTALFAEATGFGWLSRTAWFYLEQHQTARGWQGWQLGWSSVVERGSRELWVIVLWGSRSASGHWLATNAKCGRVASWFLWASRKHREQSVLNATEETFFVSSNGSKERKLWIFESSCHLIG